MPPEEANRFRKKMSQKAHAQKPNIGSENKPNGRNNTPGKR